MTPPVENGVSLAKPEKFTGVPSRFAWMPQLMPGIYAQIGEHMVGTVEVSPHAASVILDTRNGSPTDRRNRRILPSHIARLTRMMVTGKWSLNGEAIVFDEVGQLRDGQHRLMACQNACITINTFVIAGVKLNAFFSYDQGKNRTLAETLDMMGEKQARNLSAAISQLLGFFLAGSIANRSSCRLKIGTTIADLLDILSAHPGLRPSAEYVHSLSSQTTRLFGGPGLTTALHYLFSCVDPLLARKMFDAIHSYNVPGEPEWSSIRVLLKRLGDNLSSKSMDGTTTAAITIKAWNALCAKKHTGKLTFTATENYPEIYGWHYDSTNNKPIGYTQTIDGHSFDIEIDMDFMEDLGRTEAAS